MRLCDGCHTAIAVTSADCFSTGAAIRVEASSQIRFAEEVFSGLCVTIQLTNNPCHNGHVKIDVKCASLPTHIYHHKLIQSCITKFDFYACRLAVIMFQVSLLIPVDVKNTTSTCTILALCCYLMQGTCQTSTDLLYLPSLQLPY